MSEGDTPKLIFSLVLLLWDTPSFPELAWINLTAFLPILGFFYFFEMVFSLDMVTGSSYSLISSQIILWNLWDNWDELESWEHGEIAVICLPKLILVNISSLSCCIMISEFSRLRLLVMMSIMWCLEYCAFLQMASFSVYRWWGSLGSDGIQDWSSSNEDGFEFKFLPDFCLIFKIL